MKTTVMRFTNLCIVVAFLFAGSPIFSQTTEAESSRKQDSAQKRIDMKVEDLPQPIPDALEALQRIGNNVGEEISKATSKAADVVNKAVREDKPADNK